ncbi:MAG: hypothetical protein FWC16_07175 [Defluviitaleaceae bacterium]|nr:hypothetical protein [Defluviitaleaceae bacterium]MCL2274694.1 hypothetical protein [Defluviitaleaceae bacterium]
MADPKDVTVNMAKLTKDYRDTASQRPTPQPQATTRDMTVSLNEGADRFVGHEFFQKRPIVSLEHGALPTTPAE